MFSPNRANDSKITPNPNKEIVSSGTDFKRSSMLPRASAQNYSGCEPSPEEYKDKARLWARGTPVFTSVECLSINVDMFVCLCWDY